MITKRQRRLITEFEVACRCMEAIGSRRLEEHSEIEKEYKEAKRALESCIGKLNERASGVNII